MPNQFVDRCEKLGDVVRLYPLDDPDPQTVPRQTIHDVFYHSMIVRKHVFVHELGCKLEQEIDEYDGRSIHWVAYVSRGPPKGPPDPTVRPLAGLPEWLPMESIGETFTAMPSLALKSVGQAIATSVDSPKSSKAERRTNGQSLTEIGGPSSPPSAWERIHALGGMIPAGSVRLVPPPHQLHPLPGSVDGVGGTPVKTVRNGDVATKLHDGYEVYVKVGRMGVAKEYRGLHLGRLLWCKLLDWARENKKNLDNVPKDHEQRHIRQAGMNPYRWEAQFWKGLVLVHAPKERMGFWKALGFIHDEELGSWVEDGSEHVAMWYRIPGVKIHTVIGAKPPTLLYTGPNIGYTVGYASKHSKQQ